jgi:ribosomal protein L9
MLSPKLWVKRRLKRNYLVLIGKAIAAFDRCFEQIEDKDKVVAFAKRQKSNRRNATKVKARSFLEKRTAAKRAS